MECSALPLLCQYQSADIAALFFVSKVDYLQYAISPGVESNMCVKLGIDSLTWRGSSTLNATPHYASSCSAIGDSLLKIW